MSEASSVVHSDSVLNLLEGSKVYYENQEWVIVRLQSLSEVAIRCLNGPYRTTKIVEVSRLRPLPLAKEEVITSPVDVDLLTVSDEDWDIAKKRYALVRILLSRERGTTKRIKDAAKEANVTVAIIYRWRNRYLIDEKLSSLLPVKRPGGKGRGRLSEEVENVIASELVSFENLREVSIAQIYEQVKTTCFNKGLPIPCLRTFRLRIDWLDQQKLFKARRGKKAAAARFDHVNENTLRAEYPLALVQMDHAVVDVIIVHDITREPIARAWLSLAIDAYSRVVVGYYLSLEHPSATSVGACLSHAILPKDEYLRKLGRQMKWPVWGAMKIIHTDNGADFRSERLRRVFEEYEIEHQYRPVTKPQYGAYIERMIGTFAKNFRLLPGGTTNKVDKIKEFKPAADSALTMQAMEMWILEQINIYHHTPHSGIENEIPLKRFEDGLLRPKNGRVKGLPPRRTDSERVRIDFLPEIERTIQPTGVLIEGRIYWSDILFRWLGRENKKSPGRAPLYRFKTDDRDISHIYFFDPEQKKWYIIPSKYTAAVPVTRRQYQSERNVMTKDLDKKPAQHEIYDSINRQRLIVQESLEETFAVKRAAKKAAKPKKTTLKNDQKNRDNARRRQIHENTPTATENDNNGFQMPDLNNLPDVGGKF